MGSLINFFSHPFFRSLVLGNVLTSSAQNYAASRVTERCAIPHVRSYWVVDAPALDTVER